MTRPELERLAALASGELPPDEAAEVEAAAGQHPASSGTLAFMRAVIDAMRTDDSVAPSPGARERARAIFARLHPKAGRSWLDGLVTAVARLVHDSRTTAALAGLRGAGDGYRLTFDAGEIEVELQVEHGALPGSTTGPPASGCQVIGQVSATDEDASPREAGVRIAFAAPGTRTPIVEGVTDAGGMFSVVVPRGRYDLLIDDAEGVLVVPALEIP